MVFVLLPIFFLLTMSTFATSSSASSNVPCTQSAVYDVSYWTPVILLNSPFGGSSSASASVSYTGQYTFGNYQSSTSTESTQSISASNGGAQGLFELDDWRYIQYSPSGCPGIVVMHSTSGNYLTYTLLASGSSSESNEITSFSYNGYSSITFYNAYSTNNDGSIDTCPGGGYTFTASTTQTSSESVSVSFTAAGYVASGTLDIAISSSTSNTNSFAYNFPGGYGTWYYDSLNGQTGSGSSGAGALGFSYSPC